MLSSVIRGRSGQVLSPGFSKGTSFGVKTTPNVKRIGCRVLKDLIEEDPNHFVDIWLNNYKEERKALFRRILKFVYVT